MELTTAIEHAQMLDAADELISFRDEFLIDDPGLVYLDSASLGRPPRIGVVGLAQVGPEPKRRQQRKYEQLPAEHQDVRR